MKTTKTETSWIEKVGAPAYGAIEEMVDALDADYAVLECLREERDDHDPDDHDGKTWEQVNPDDAQDLDFQAGLAGECENEEAARERIMEDPLSLRIFGERVDGEWEATDYELLLATGGPAVRIVGDISDYGCDAGSARLEVQDWGKPWTEYHGADSDVLLRYASCFCFE